MAGCWECRGGGGEGGLLGGRYARTDAQPPPRTATVTHVQPPARLAQTVLDAAGVLEGLKKFKYLDDKGKDQGINVSERSWVLGGWAAVPAG